MAFDRNSAADLATLKNEVINDPNSYGYNIDDSYDIVDKINLKRAGITISKPKISAAAIRSLCTFDAYNRLSIDEQEWLRWITGSNGFEEENIIVTSDLRTQLTEGNNSIWAAADRTEMTAAMLSLIDVEGSRAEELFGFATSISRDDWIAARDS